MRPGEKKEKKKTPDPDRSIVSDVGITVDLAGEKGFVVLVDDNKNRGMVGRISNFNDKTGEEAYGKREAVTEMRPRDECPMYFLRERTTRVGFA